MLSRTVRQFPALLFAGAALIYEAVAGFASTNHHVVLVTMDGLAAFYLSDPRAPLPTLRKLAAEGAAAEGLRVSNPSVTWPNHTTLVTGVHPDKHSVLFNGIMVRPGPGEPVRIDPFRDKEELVAVPTLYDHLHRAGYRTAGINWPCTRGAATLDDDFPDVPEQIAHTTPRLRDELIAAGILDDKTDASFRSKSAASRDRMWTASAVHVIQKRRPNFLLVHMLITDTIQHRYAPQSPAAYTAVALADAQLAEIVAALRSAGMLERTTIFVTADHGFGKPTKLVNPNVLFRKAGLMRPQGKTRIQSVSEGGTAIVYLNDPSSLDEDRAKALELLSGHEGIAEILQPSDFPAHHYPDPARNPQMGRLVLVANEGYAFSNDNFSDNSITELAAPSGSHGYLATNPDMNSVFVAWGRGIKRGSRIGLVNSIDVAPTIAKLLGQELPDADGKVLSAILAP